MLAEGAVEAAADAAAGLALALALAEAGAGALLAGAAELAGAEVPLPQALSSSTVTSPAASFEVWVIACVIPPPGT